MEQRLWYSSGVSNVRPGDQNWPSKDSNLASLMDLEDVKDKMLDW